MNLSKAAITAIVMLIPESRTRDAFRLLVVEYLLSQVSDPKRALLRKSLKVVRVAGFGRFYESTEHWSH